MKFKRDKPKTYKDYLRCEIIRLEKKENSIERESEKLRYKKRIEDKLIMRQYGDDIMG